MMTRQRGFTIAELITACGLIALGVLVSVQLVHPAWLMARSISCVSNVKQMSLAMRQYSEDYGGASHRSRPR